MSATIKIVLAAAVCLALILACPTIVDMIVLYNVHPDEAQVAQATQSLPIGALATPQNPTSQIGVTPLPVTQTPLPSPTVVVPSPTVVVLSPTAELNSVGVQQRLIIAESVLRTGDLSVRADYGGGNSAMSRVRFDFGDAQQPARLAITSIYTNSTQTHVTERVTVGNQTWQRQDKGAWMVSQEQTTVAEQVQPFLPMAASMTDPRIAYQEKVAALAWSDSSRDADLVLLVDITSGIPQEMRQKTRQTDQELTVTYHGWNTPVEIEPPDVKQ